jgi:tetratricopeptide (TPR) repeat protein
LRVLVLLLLIAGLIYVERIVVPQTAPLFVVTAIPTRSAASIILEAESLFQAGNLRQAESAYRQAIQADPEQVNYYSQLARVQVFAGDYDKAVTNASNAVLLDPNSAMANAVLGWALDFQSQTHPELADIAEAREKLERAIQLDPNSALVHALYAEVIIDDDISAFQDARDQAELAVQMDPNLLEAQRALGYVWERTGNYQLAFEAYQSALRINPNLALLHISIGNMYFNLGEIDQALQSYLRASTFSPDDVVPLRLIVQAYASDGEFGKASQYAQSAVDLDPEQARLHGDLGRMFYKNGDYQSAIASLSLAIQGGTYQDGVAVRGMPLDPGDPLVVDVYSMYGLALARQSQCGQAIGVAEMLVTGVPDNEIAAANAEQILVLCGELGPPATPEG